MDRVHPPSSETPLLGGTSTSLPAMLSAQSSDDAAENEVFQDPETTETARPKIASHISRQLYVSHFLSTWNSRVFEFGAILFIAAIFPRTLLPASVYALARSASAIVLSPAVGHYIDNGNRLQVVRFSIGKSPAPLMPLSILQAHYSSAE
jgi:Ferroportin1 (FPN1)